MDFLRFGDEYTSTAPRMDMVNGSRMDAEPIAIFTFRYRPLGAFRVQPVVMLFVLNL